MEVCFKFTPPRIYFNSINNVTMGIPPCKLILGETMTWHVEHMLDVGSFEVGQGQNTLLEVIVKNLQAYKIKME